MLACTNIIQDPREDGAKRASPCACDAQPRCLHRRSHNWTADWSHRAIADVNSDRLGCTADSIPNWFRRTSTARRIYSKRGDENRAIADLDQALLLEPSNSARSWISRGPASPALGDSMRRRRANCARGRPLRPRSGSRPIRLGGSVVQGPDRNALPIIVRTRSGPRSHSTTSVHHAGRRPRPGEYAARAARAQPPIGSVRLQSRNQQDAADRHGDPARQPATLGPPALFQHRDGPNAHSNKPRLQRKRRGIMSSRLPDRAIADPIERRGTAPHRLQPTGPSTAGRYRAAPLPARGKQDACPAAFHGRI